MARTTRIEEYCNQKVVDCDLSSAWLTRKTVLETNQKLVRAISVERFGSKDNFPCDLPKCKG